MSAGLVARNAGEDGFDYRAEEAAGPLLANLQSEYLGDVKVRADWFVDKFDEMSNDELIGVTKKLFEAWTVEFLPTESNPKVEQPT